MNARRRSCRKSAAKRAAPKKSAAKRAAPKKSGVKKSLPKQKKPVQYLVELTFTFIPDDEGIFPSEKTLYEFIARETLPTYAKYLLENVYFMKLVPEKFSAEDNKIFFVLKAQTKKEILDYVNYIKMESLPDGLWESKPGTGLVMKNGVLDFQDNIKIYRYPLTKKSASMKI